MIEKEKTYIPVWMPKSVWLAGMCFGLLFAVLYAVTASQAAIPYGDSNELLAVGNNLGVAHPPGYSVYITLLSLFMHLPLPGTMAFKGALLSAVFHSTALTLFFVFLWRLIAFIQENSSDLPKILSQQLDRYLLSSIGVVTLGTSFLFWLYGSVTEKFSLNSLLLSGMLVLISFIITTSPQYRKKWWWYGLGSLFGLAIAHHQTFVILVPVLLLLVWQERKTLNLKTTLLSAASLLSLIALSFALLFIINNRQVQVSWHFEPTLRGIWHHVSRQAYSGSLPSGQKVQAYLTTITPSSMIQILPRYLWILTQHFGWISTVLVGLSLLFIRKLPKNVALLSVVGLGITALLFPLLTGWPDNLGLLAIGMRQYLLGYMFISWFAVIGWWFVLVRLRKITKVLSQNQLAARICAIAVVLVVLGVNWVGTWQKVQLKSFNFYPRLMTAVLKELPPNSLLACFSDFDCSTLLYLQQVEKERPDVVLLTVTYPLNNQLNTNDQLHGFDYADEPFKSLDYITWNIGKRPVFAVNIPDAYFSLFGMDYGFMYFIPHGYFGELTREVPKEMPSTQYNFTQELLKTSSPSTDLMRLWTKVAVGKMHILNAEIYQRMGLREQAREELNLAANLMFQVPQISQKEIEGVRQKVEYTSPYESYKPGTKVQSTEEILKASDILLEKGRLNKAYQGILGAMIIDPLSEEARMKLAQVYEKENDKKYALIEYRNVLKYHPDNQQAIQKIVTLERQ